MSKNFYYIIGIAVIVTLGLFMWGKGSPDSSSPNGKTQKVLAQLMSQNNSGESGTVAFAAMGEQTKVILDLQGAPKGVIQPSHIHSGSCANLGGVKYPLTSLTDGLSETVLDLSLAGLTSQLPLAVNVHKSSPEIGVYAACGDIILDALK